MITSYLKGHLITFSKGKWNKTPKHCKRCGKDTEHDYCLGMLPGVKNACCGHGIPGEGYIMFENGITIRGDFKVGNNNIKR